MNVIRGQSTLIIVAEHDITHIGVQGECVRILQMDFTIRSHSQPHGHTICLGY